MSTLKATNLQNASSSTVNIELDSSANATINGNGIVEGDLQFDSGYGSAVKAYGVRAWIHFNGSGTISIRDSGSVSSITDNGTGNYNVNLSITLPDTNGMAFGCKKHNAGAPTVVEGAVSASFIDTSTLRVISGDWDGTYLRSGGYDSPYLMVGVIR